ncbi:MAG: hypothetical protein RR240_09195, partial [Burkholderiaceae bacterium]
PIKSPIKPPIKLGQTSTAPEFQNRPETRSAKPAHTGLANGAQAHARRVPLCVRDEARHCRRRAPRRLQCCQTTIPLQAQRGAKKPAAGFATDRIQSGAIEKRLTEHLGHVPPPIARGKNIWCT